MFVFCGIVSLLESDNDYYNQGIVDVSHKYPKMYVIRPQFFIPFISLLRNEARNTLAYRHQLAEVRNQNLDIERFGEALTDFKGKFSKNCDLAFRQYNEAIKQINESIAHLEKTRDNLTSSMRNLRLANDKAEDLSIKKLCKNSPSLLASFEASGEVI